MRVVSSGVRRTLVFGGLLTLGCSGSVSRVSAPIGASGPPSIESLVDLGGYEPKGVLDAGHSDETITPGEWLRVTGQHLSTTATNVHVRSKTLPVLGYLSDGSILVRVPAGLSPLRTHELEIRTPHGRARQTFSLSSYVLVADIGGEQLRFFRASGDEAEVLSEQVTALDLDELGPVALSPEHGFAYAIASQPDDLGYAWFRAHLGAADAPAADRSGHFQLRASARDLALGHDGTLFVLTANSIEVFGGERALGKLELGPAPPLPESQWSLSNLVLFDDERHAAALEVFTNQVLVFDVTDRRRPALAATFPVDSQGEPIVVALGRNPTVQNELWVLTGANQHMLGTALKRALDVRGWLPIGAPPVLPEWNQLAARLERLTWQDQGLVRQTPLRLPPGFVPTSLGLSPEGRPWVTGITSSWFQIDSETSGVAAYASALFRTTEVGHLIELGADGQPTTTQSGMMICFNPTYLPGETLP
ncbi:MAG TPA: hypothetical protein VFU02_24310, partial [Polyangiaceae bacterium]|nr:hypothetical protein [Polyangiaceae bacterium]